MITLRLRQAAQRLAQAEDKRDRYRALAEFQRALDEYLTRPRADFSQQAVALLLSSTAPSTFFKTTRKYYVRKFGDFDALVDLVKDENPNFQEIKL